MDDSTELPEFDGGSLAATASRLETAVVAVHGRRGYPLSGVVWDEHLIVTTHRAVGRDDRVAISFADGERVPAELVGRDPSTDLALLRVERALTAPERRVSSELQVGQPVLRLARPRGQLRASFGIVVAIEGRWRGANGGMLDAYLLSDARAYRGFSGGPLVTLDGGVAGLTTRALDDNPISIPSETVERVAASLLEHGHIPRGYLGLTGQALRLPESLRELAGGGTGLLITSVESGSPASASGLALGDTLIFLGGEAVAHPGALAALLGADTVGSEMPIVFLRGGERHETTIVVGERPRR